MFGRSSPTPHWCVGCGSKRPGTQGVWDQVDVLAEAITCALDLNDHGMVKQPVQQGRGDNGIAKHLAPFAKAAVGGQDHRALLVAGIDQLEEQIAVAGGDRQVADLIDDQQRGATEKPNAFAQIAFTFGLGERGDNVGQGGEP
jgi:hypothetical protein